MGRGKSKRGNSAAEPSPTRSGSVLSAVERYRSVVAENAGRIAVLGNWPAYINPEESLAGRVPTATATASGFDAGIASALDLIPRTHQKLAACLHAAYTPAAVEQVRAEAGENGQALEADSQSAWWLAACSVCTEGEITPEDFVQQLEDFKALARSPEKRLAAAQATYQAMSQAFWIADGVAFGTEDGAMQGAYVAGHDLAVVYDEKADLYFIGTFRESLGLEGFPWSDAVDEQGRARSGPVHGSRQFVKAASPEEYQRVLAALRANP
jgi:hypothetical protein